MKSFVRRLRFEPLEDRTTPATVYALNASGTQLLRFDTATPTVIDAALPVSGLAVGGATESLVALDFRPATGQLYALGINNTAGPDEGRLYVLNTLTGQASLVGSGPFSSTLSDGASYGFDFNPVLDQLRIINDADQNIRVNPDTGALILADTVLTFAPGDPNTGDPAVVGAAYSNNTAGAATTTLFGIDFTRDRLLRIGGPNGTPSPDGGLLFDVGGLGFDATAAVGFDITAGDVAFATLSTAGGTSQLVQLNLGTGLATVLGTVGGSTGGLIRGMAIARPGTVAFSSASFTGTEGGNAVLTLTRTGGFDGSVSFVVTATGGTATNGSDFTGVPVTVTFGPGETTRTVTLPLPDDTIAEGSETLNLAVTPGAGPATVSGQGTTILTILDNEPPDTTVPTVTINQAAGQPDPTNNSTVFYTVVFSEPVTGFGADDVILSGQAADGATVAVTGSGTTYTVAVSGFTRAGPLFADVRAGAATDAAGNPSQASTSTDNRIVIASGVGVGLDRTIPTDYAVGAGAGGGTVVRVFHPNGTEKFSFLAFGSSFTGGVRVATADFNGDGVADIAVGTGPGVLAQVRVIDGKTQAELFALTPFEGFVGGVFVAAGDITGDGRADLVITPDLSGGPRVRIFSGDGFGQIADFFGIADTAFRGGARAAVGDVNFDGFGDLIVAAGFGGGPRVALFSGSKITVEGRLAEQSLPRWETWKLIGDFFTFEPGLRNGVFVGAGDLDADGNADLFFGAGPGGGPRVRVASGARLLSVAPTSLDDSRAVTGNVQIANFFAGDVNNRGGIRVAVKNLDLDNRADLVVGAGVDAGSRVTAYAGKNIPAEGTPPELYAFDAFSGFTAGVFVG